MNASLEFRCNGCGRKVTLLYKTCAEYDGDACLPTLSQHQPDPADPVSPSGARIARLMSDNTDDSMFDDRDGPIAHDGPALREMSGEMGEDRAGVRWLSGD